MPENQLLTLIRTLEAQLAVLKVRYQKSLAEKPKTFAELYGLLKGEVQSTDEDIEAALFKFEWEGKEQR